MSVGSLEAFKTLSDRVFKIFLEDGSRVNVKLDELVVNEQAPANFESFSLYFKGNKDELLTQGTYRLINAELGQLMMFLSPKGDDPEAVYEAVYNQERL